MSYSDVDLLLDRRSYMPYSSQKKEGATATEFELQPVPPVAPYYRQSNAGSTPVEGGGSESTSHRTGEPWRPGFWVQFPLFAVVALVGVLGCAVASLIILASSNGKIVDTWGGLFAPSVYLSILSVCTNVLLGFAFANGMVISFWRKALNGCELPELHYQWVSGHSIVSAIMSLFRGRSWTSSIACIVVTASMIRGPLYQRASTVNSNVLTDINGTTTVTIAQQLPDGYTGHSTYSRAPVRETSSLTGNFTEISKEYTARTTIILPHSYCGNACDATVTAFGFGINCSTTKLPQKISQNSSTTWPLFETSVDILDLSSTGTQEISSTEYNAGLRLNATFYTGESWIDPTDPADALDFHQNLTSHVCDLTPGIIDYDVSLSNGTATLLNPNDLSNRLVTHLDLAGPSSDGQSTSIGDFQYVGDLLFSSSSTYIFGGAVSSVKFDGSLANQFVVNSNLDAANLTFDDPMTDMVSAIREMAFRSAIRVASQDASWPNITQTVPYRGTRTDTRYSTDWVYGATAASLSILGVGVVALTLWGFWEIGRPVTLSPLEIARAFDAPAFKGTSGNVTVDRLVKDVQGRKLRYGVVQDEKAQEALLISDAERTRKPRPEKRY